MRSHPSRWNCEGWGTQFSGRGMKAGPSTALRFGRDDKFGVEGRTQQQVLRFAPDDKSFLVVDWRGGVICDPTLRDGAAKDGAPSLVAGGEKQVPPLRCASVGMTNLRVEGRTQQQVLRFAQDDKS